MAVLSRLTPVSRPSRSCLQFPDRQGAGETPVMRETAHDQTVAGFPSFSIASVFANVFSPLRLCVCCILLICTGCAQTPNPSFPITIQDASRDIDRMEAAPIKLNRPLVVIGGFIDPGIVPLLLGWQFDSITKDDRIVTVAMGDCFSFERCREKVIEAVEAKFPSGDPKQTIEVDVVGMSMGGLVARFAAMPNDGSRKQLRIARLFTISSPLRGAESAVRWPPLHPLMKPMQPGSPMITEINARDPNYAVYSYVRLSDHVVGVSNAAIPGRTAWWVATPWLNDAHNAAMFDPRIVADIARRLRDETPLASDPPAPLAKG